MADHRKCFRPRRLTFGGRLFPRVRILPRGCIFGAALALLSALGPALAEDAGLKSGAASLAAGKYDNAVRQLSATVNSENASPGEAAKALYLRGIAYRKLGQPARAIADLGAAIWLGLPDQDRVKALVNRGLAFQAAGLSSQGEAELAQARKLGGSGAVDQLIAEGGGSAGTADIAAFATEVRPEDQGGSSAGARAEPLPGFNTSVSGGEAPAPPSTRTADASPKSAGDAPSSWSTSVNGDSTPPSSGNRLTRWFGSLTDSSGSSSAGASSAPTPAPSAPRAAPAQAAAPAPVNSSWTTKTETQEAPSGSEGGGQSKGWGRWFNKTAEAEPPAAPAAAPSAAGGGGYRLQLATSQSEEDAKALYKKVASQNPELASKQPEIEKVDIGNFGTFYSLKIGPFPDKAESLKLCNALKRSGVDCLLATP
ncbi:MAG TPA: SPOR domain-containing protein [Methyloceanibacter sp.]|jgi:tetratricopeptide (TPR) repeat protein|nr:SPOR domain-containing protein [Methyloceanibacter sp.]